MKQWRRWLIWVGLLLFVGGCTVEEKGMKPNDDWSRGVPLGQFAQGMASLVVQADGARVDVVWPFAQGEEKGIRYVQLGSEGEAVVTTDLVLPPGLSRQPRLVAGRDGGNHLIWGQREAGASGWVLWHGWLGADGVLAGERPLTAVPTPISSYVTVSDEQGGAWLVWENTADNGLYGGHMTADGRWSEAIWLAEGTKPAVTVGDDGHLYLSWVNGGWLQFALLGEGLTAAEPVPVRNLALSQGDLLYGPDVRVVDGWAYLTWGIFSTSGMESGVGHTDYMMIDLASMEMVLPERLFLSPAEKLPYEAHVGDYGLTTLVPPGSVRGSSSYVYQGGMAPAYGDEVLLVVSTEQAMGMGSQNQLAVAVFAEGAVQGYGMASRTSSLSQNPAIAVDGQGGLHLVWQEGSSYIFYATTEPLLRAKLDALSPADALPVFFNGGIDAAIGLLFFWLAVVWMGPALVLLYGAQWFGYFGEMNERGTVAWILVAVALTQWVKVSFMETMKSYVPFSAWIDIPVEMAATLQIGVPVLFLVVSLVATLLIWQRRYLSGMMFYFTWMGIEALLTLAIYGVTLVGGG